MDNDTTRSLYTPGWRETQAQTGIRLPYAAILQWLLRFRQGLEFPDKPSCVATGDDCVPVTVAAAPRKPVLACGWLGEWSPHLSSAAARGRLDR